MPKEHGKTGEFVETVALADVLGTFDDVEGPVILSADVADRLDCSRETARRKLEQLHDRGDVDRRKVSRRVLYWRPDESGRERGETPTEDTPEGSPPDVPDGALDGWSYGRGEGERTANQTLARRSLAWLRDTPTGPVQQGDVPLADWAEDDPRDREPATLWRTVVRGAWNHAVEQGYVEKPGKRSYAWTGDDDQTDSGVYDPTEEFDQ
jgi:hypothetical protein